MLSVNVCTHFADSSEKGVRRILTPCIKEDGYMYMYMCFGAGRYPKVLWENVARAPLELHFESKALVHTHQSPMDIPSLHL